MSWRCSRLRRKLALMVGDDLPGTETVYVEQHLRHCPACREYYADLSRTREAMLQTAVADQSPEYSSLWPALGDRLDSARSAASSRFSQWLPVGALAAVSLAIMLVLFNLPAGSDSHRATGPGIRPSVVGITDRPVAHRDLADPWEFDDAAGPDRAGASPTTPSYFPLELVRPVSFLGEDF